MEIWTGRDVCPQKNIKRWEEEELYQIRTLLSHSVSIHSGIEFGGVACTLSIIVVANSSYHLMLDNMVLQYFETLISLQIIHFIYCIQFHWFHEELHISESVRLFQHIITRQVKLALECKVLNLVRLKFFAKCPNYFSYNLLWTDKSQTGFFYNWFCEY